METLSLYRSPKRKRDASESERYSRSASPPSSGSIISLQDSRVREESQVRACSPRSTVAGRLKKLYIHGEGTSNPESQRGHPNMGDKEQFHWTDGETEFAGNAKTHAAPDTGSSSRRDEESLGCDKQQNEQEPVAYAHSRGAELTANSRRSLSLSRPSSRRKSPPLSGNANEDPLTWHDSEITGHCPTDPNDDGYGINGIGFKPTAAVAWARSQKRQKQVAEWKHREGREAREKRRERREGIGGDKMRKVQEGSVQKKVKFKVED
jgi:hypothetical protein